MKNKILILLVLSLALPVFAGCDGGDDPNVSETHAGDSQSESVMESVTNEETEMTMPTLEFGPLLGSIDFSNLAQSTDGQAYAEAIYDRFLASVDQNPEQVLHDGESGNYFRALTSDAEEKRHNILLKMTTPDQKKWTYCLVSTKDDFALLAQDAKKKKAYAVGLIDGQVVDQFAYMDEADFTLLSDMIREQGYETVLNQIRDEFFYQLFELTENENNGYKLGFTGKTHNMWEEDHTLKPVMDREYTMSEIQLVNAEDISEVFTTMESTYDIPDEYLKTLLEAYEENENAGREAEQPQ